MAAEDAGRGQCFNSVPIQFPAALLTTQAWTWAFPRLSRKMYSNERLSEEKLLEEETTRDDGDVPGLRSKRRSRYFLYIWGFHLIFLFANISTLISTLSYRHRTLRDDCKDHMPMYSPALDAVRGTGHFERFDGSFATPNAYKGTPNSDIDAAWANITYENGSYAPPIHDGLFADCGRRCHQYI